MANFINSNAYLTIIDNALLVDIDNSTGVENKPAICNSKSKNIPENFSWGIREVLYLNSSEIILRLTGIKNDGVTHILAINIYNHGHWIGWKIY